MGEPEIEEQHGYSGSAENVEPGHEEPEDAHIGTVCCRCGKDSDLGLCTICW